MGLILSMSILVCTISFIEALEDEILRGLDSVNNTLKVVSQKNIYGYTNNDYDLEKVTKLLPKYLSSSYVYTTSGTVSKTLKNKFNSFVSILGIEDDFFNFIDVTMITGDKNRLLKSNYNGTPECIIDSKAFQNLFLGDVFIPNTIQVADFPCQLIGVYETKYNIPRIPTTYSVITNTIAFREHFDKKNTSKALLLVQSNNKNETDIVNTIINALGLESVLEVTSAEALISLKKKISTSISLIVYSFIFVFLLISCFSVAGVKVLEVSDREGEIGLKLALGAKRFDIIKDVIISSTLFTLFGGIIGIVIGGLITAFLISPILLSSSLLKVGVVKLNFNVIVTALLLLTTVSFISSYLPAKRALSVDPSLTMRKI